MNKCTQDIQPIFVVCRLTTTLHTYVHMYMHAYIHNCQRNACRDACLDPHLNKESFSSTEMENGVRVKSGEIRCLTNFGARVRWRCTYSLNRTVRFYGCHIWPTFAFTFFPFQSNVLYIQRQRQWPTVCYQKRSHRPQGRKRLYNCLVPNCFFHTPGNETSSNCRFPPKNNFEKVQDSTAIFTQA